jgi:hypothetical protein
VEAEDTRAFEARKSAAAAVPAVAKRAQNELFDHTMGVLAAEDPPEEDTFGGILRASAAQAATVPPGTPAPSLVDAPLIALICQACGSFYLAEEKPSDARLLDTCPKCLGLEP